MTFSPGDSDRASGPRVGLPALILSLVLFLGVWAWAWVVLPEDGVVHHLGGSGLVRLGSRAGLLWPLLGLVLILVSTRWLIVWIARRQPSMLSHPHKDYWLAPERREGFIRRMVDEMDLVFAGTFLLVVVGIIEVVGVTLERGWPSLMWPALAGYAVFLVWWVWWMLRRSVPPRS